ncbi:MAG: ribonuclease III [Lachnospiraceae bacterium]|nr:ribonuclease III [Lachnospiraceae bacterium]
MEYYERLGELEERIGYHFKDISLLRQAMTHSSFSNEQKMNRFPHYERVEYLGDAVLEMVSSDYFYHAYPKEPEGKLTKLRAAAVCEQALAITARDLDLGGFMVFGRGEAHSGGSCRESIIADAVEAVIGAIYLDGGIDEARRFIHTFVLNDLDKKRLFYDAKSILQEKVQEMKTAVLEYELIKEEGPEHDKRFVVEARLNGHVIGVGEGKNKKSAQQQAAFDALDNGRI